MENMYSNKISGDKVAEERKYFLSVLKTFLDYKEQSFLRIKNKEYCLSSLPCHHQKWLTQYNEDLEKYKKCIEKNAELIPIFLQNSYNIFENGLGSDSPFSSDTKVPVLSEGLEKVQSVFKQLMRDWSSVGASERQQCYTPIIEEVEHQFPDDKFIRSEVNVLVPGAGLGRLAFEIAHRGFSCQGNEFNLFMLIASFYVLNLCKKVDEFEIYPWIHQYCNNLSAEHQTLSVRFPDVCPTPIPESKFSMTAGDFVEVYTEPNEWNCVATCFFIDCAPNVVHFVELIYHILKPGGVWINLGPLLYHYSDAKNEKSIEPSFEVLCEVISRVGFVMEKKKIGVKTRYCQNPMSMLQYEYDSVFFVCRKPVIISNGDLITTSD
ncbi:carnosine N-methyltransferase [Agrilus planipennis]|uniref:Carnosine N-methyltransferase n=1 Tax=Agrilus planipennis TaxID=224129 RepID=A0A1W4X6G4_AGRPL|nr:carnosine N-methyltransferase [Agrilus planipennis]